MQNSTPLTDEQRDKFAANVGLIRSAIKRLTKTVREVVGCERLYDMAIDVLTIVVRKHDPSRAKLSTMFWFWFVRRAVSLQVRTSQKTPVHQLTGDEDVPARVDDVTMNSDEVIEYINTLTPDEQKLLRARYQDGRDLKDIARDYSVTGAAIRWRIARIIKVLREKLNPTTP